MKKLFIVLAVAMLILVPVGVCLYVDNNGDKGEVHARDLGVHPDAQDLVSAQTKFRVLRKGQAESLNSGELTAWLQHAETAATPLVDSQVRINSDNSIEISGLLVTDQIVPYTSARGISAEQAQLIVEQLGRNRLVPLYIRCQGGMNNGQLDLTIKTIEVDDTGVPRFMIRDKQDDIEQILQEVLLHNHIQEIRVENREIELR